MEGLTDSGIQGSSDAAACFRVIRVNQSRAGCLIAQCRQPTGGQREQLKESSSSSQPGLREVTFYDRAKLRTVGAILPFGLDGSACDVGGRGRSTRDRLPVMEACVKGHGSSLPVMEASWLLTQASIMGNP